MAADKPENSGGNVIKVLAGFELQTCVGCTASFNFMTVGYNILSSFKVSVRVLFAVVDEISF